MFTVLRGNLSIILLLFACYGQAGVSLDKTRIIFPAEKQSQTVTFSNSGTQHYLVQAMVTKLDSDTPSDAFMVVPPLFRSEGEHQNLLKIIRTRKTLPQNRESAFRLRLNIIPASTKMQRQEEAVVSATLGIAIKLFYRPDNLSATPDESYGGLLFRKEQQGISVFNPSAYYVSFSKLSLGRLVVNIDKYASMIPPGGKVTYPLVTSENQAVWQAIDDFGAGTKVFQSQIK